MKLAAWLVVGVSLCGLPPAANALDLTAGSGAARRCPESGRGAIFTAGAVGWLEPAPVVTYDNYGGDSYSPASEGNRGIAVGFAELSGAAFGFCLGAVYRQEYIGLASRDLLDILRGNHLDKPFDPGRSYTLKAELGSLRAAGLRLRKMLDFSLPNGWSLRAGIGVSLLEGLGAQHQTVNGSLTATSSSWATGMSTWSRIKRRVDENDFNPYVPRGNPRGRGYSSDLQIILKSEDGWQVDFIAMDLYGRMHWQDIPHSLKTLNNSEISYNANFDQDAAITGMDSIAGFSQRIEPKYRLALASRPLAGWSALASDDAVSGVHFPAVGIRHQSRAGTAELTYDIRTNAVTAAFGTSDLNLALTTSDLNLNRASVLGLFLQTALTW